jgi:hypothetical protein
VQTDSHAAYADNWRTDIEVRNDGTQSHDVVLYRVGDCASGEQDGGWLTTPGFIPAIQQSIGCRAINDGENAFQRVSLYPFPTADAHGDENLTPAIWNAVAHRLRPACVLLVPAAAPGARLSCRSRSRRREHRALLDLPRHLRPRRGDQRRASVRHPKRRRARRRGPPEVSIGSYVGQGPAGLLRRSSCGCRPAPSTSRLDDWEITGEPTINGDTLSWQTSLNAYSGQYRSFAFRFRARSSPAHTPGVWAATSPATSSPSTRAVQRPHPRLGRAAGHAHHRRSAYRRLRPQPVVAFHLERPWRALPVHAQPDRRSVRTGGAAASPDTLGPLADGSYTFTVAAVDRFGRVDPSSAMAKFTIIEPPAGSAPDTAIDDGPTGLTNNRTPTFVVRASDSTARLECRVVGDPAQSTFAPCAATTRVGTLADAEARAVGAAGRIRRPQPAPSSSTRRPRHGVGAAAAGRLPGPRGYHRHDGALRPTTRPHRASPARHRAMRRN